MLEAYAKGRPSGFRNGRQGGNVHVVIKKDASGLYPDKNAVADYLKAKSLANDAEALARFRRTGMDDDTPF